MIVDKNRSVPRPLAAGLLCLALALPVLAYRVKEPLSKLDQLVFSKPQLRITRSIVDADNLRELVPNRAAFQRFRAQYGKGFRFLIDKRTGRVNLLDGGAIPFIPGPANKLAWRDFGDADCTSIACIPSSRVESLAKDFLSKNRDALEVDTEDLKLDPASVAAVGSSNYLLRFQWTRSGVPIEGGSVFFSINNGNLIQVGMQNIGPISVDAKPTYGMDRAWEVVTKYVGTGARGGDQVLERGTLIIEPITPKGMNPESLTVPFGKMIDYVLTYRFVFRRPGVIGTWEALVDAHTGELLRFADLDRYGHVQGGVYKTDFPQTEVTMPFGLADYGSGVYANAIGDFPSVMGTSTLTGNNVGGVRITDGCGSISLAAAGGGLIDFGNAGGVGTDCAAGASGGAGNTHASRTQYWNATAIKAKGLSYLPGNVWLQGQLTDAVNISPWCNAQWDGIQLNFYTAAGTCRNTGELPGVSMHEWGHGMDSNDGSGGGTDNRPVESRADYTALLQTHQSCTGSGLFTAGNCSGYGDVCSACSGIRDADWAQHASGTAWTPQNMGSSWSCAPGGYNGPCGWEDHCESGIATQALWDFVNRDLIAAPTSMDLVSAWQLEDRLFYTGMPQSTDMYTCTGTSPKVSDGCAAGSLYNVMRAIDDDGDGTANGTPHAAAIFAALNRHGIACGAAGDPTNQNQTSCPALTAPMLTATANSHQVTLNWTTGGAAATRYFVFRNETGCAAGYTMIATVMAPTLTYTDNAVVNGLTYFYRVQAATANASCVSAMSGCATVAVTLPADRDFYVRDWNNAPMQDNGEQPSTNGVFWYSSDVWNRATNAPGAPNAQGFFPTDDMQAGAGSLGDNYGFVRVRRNSTGSAATVTAHFLVSPFGTGSSFQDAGPTADPTLVFAAGDSEQVLSSGYLWNQPATASTHACIAVQIATTDDPYQAPSLLGQTPGPGDYLVIDDNNKAQRNLEVSHNTFVGPGLAYALIHNSALYPRDLMIRYESPAGDRMRNGSVDIVDGRTSDFRSGATVTLPAMQPGENRWIALRHQVPEGVDVPIHFEEIDNGKPVNGFTFVARAAPVSAMIRENLKNHVQAFNRLAAAFRTDAAKKQADAAATLLSTRDVSPKQYAQFVKANAKAIAAILRPILAKNANNADPFGIAAAVRDLTAAAGKGDPDGTASQHSMLLSRLDAFATMLQKADGDAADIRQMVRWQQALYQGRSSLQKLQCAQRVVGDSQRFLAASRRNAGDDYPALLDGLSSCFHETARAIGQQQDALQRAALAIDTRPSSLDALEKLHRQYLLILQDAAGAVQH